MQDTTTNPAITLDRTYVPKTGVSKFERGNLAVLDELLGICLLRIFDLYVPFPARRC